MEQMLFPVSEMSASLKTIIQEVIRDDLILTAIDANATIIVKKFSVHINVICMAVYRQTNDT